MTRPRQRLARTAAMLALACLCTMTVAASGWWIELGGSASAGGISDNPGYSDFPSTALDSKGHPVVVWSDTFKGTRPDLLEAVERFGVGRDAGGPTS